MARGIFREGAHYFRPPASDPLFSREALIAWIEKPAEQKPGRLRMAGGYMLGSGNLT